MTDIWLICHWFKLKSQRNYKQNFSQQKPYTIFAKQLLFATYNMYLFRYVIFGIWYFVWRVCNTNNEIFQRSHSESIVKVEQHFLLWKYLNIIRIKTINLRHNLCKWSMDCHLKLSVWGSGIFSHLNHPFQLPQHLKPVARFM